MKSRYKKNSCCVLFLHCNVSQIEIYITTLFIISANLWTLGIEIGVDWFNQIMDTIECRGSAFLGASVLTNFFFVLFIKKKCQLGVHWPGTTAATGRIRIEWILAWFCTTNDITTRAARCHFSIGHWRSFVHLYWLNFGGWASVTGCCHRSSRHTVAVFEHEFLDGGRGRMVGRGGATHLHVFSSSTAAGWSHSGWSIIVGDLFGLLFRLVCGDGRV